MKTIEYLTVKITHTVRLSNVQVPDEVCKALYNSYDKGGEVDTDSFKIASEWISEHIRVQWIEDMVYKILMI